MPIHTAVITVAAVSLPVVGPTSPILLAGGTIAVIAILGMVAVIARKAGLVSSNQTFVDDHNTPADGDADGEPAQQAPEGPSASTTNEQVDEQTNAHAAGDASVAEVETLGDEMQVLDDRGERQLSGMAPRHIREDEDYYEHLRIDDHYTRSYFIDGWPDSVSDGQFRGLFSQPGFDFDIALHIDPLDSPHALEDLKERIRELESEYELLADDGQTIEARDVERKLQDYQAMRDAIRDTNAEFVDVSMYVTVAADSKAELDRVSDQFEDTLQENGLRPILKTKDQERTLRSTSPIAKDELEKKHSMMGGAIGAMLPFSSGTLIQDEGIPIGIHAENSSPIIYDRFTHDRGYNMLTIGNIGAGKSFSTKLHLLRHKLYDDDTIVIMLDPLRGFAGLNSALDGQQIVVGGDFALNPLEIKEPPESVKDDPQVNPGTAKMKDLKSFFESFFDMRGEELGEKWTTLQRALRTAYHERGIDLDDPDTHARQSPTIREDVIPILLEMVTDVEEHSIIQDIIDDETAIEEVLNAAQEVTEEERRRAAELLLAMEPFLDGGALANLGESSDFDIEDEDVVWLDLQQQESRGGLGLMMNLLFSAVYERAKQTDKEVIFAIDEARYIMRDKAALEFLEQAVRHSRHYDLSIQFITQTVDEFFQHEEAEAIADQCDHKLFFHTEGLDNEVASKVGMSETEAQFVRTATPGDEERGYSEAAFGVADEGWYPVHISANPKEAAVVDLDPDEDIRAALPGMNDDEVVPEEVREIREQLLEKYSDEVEVEVKPEKLVPEIRAVGEDGKEVIVDQDEIRRSGPNLDKIVSDALDLADDEDSSEETSSDDSSRESLNRLFDQLENGESDSDEDE
jgi:hypothetical protein